MSKRIFHIAKWYPDRNDDLSGVFVQKHIEAINQINPSVVIYCAVDPNLKNKKAEITHRVINGVPTYKAYYKKDYTGFGPIDKFIKLRLYFYLMHRAFDMAKSEYGTPDLLHCHILLRTGLFAKKIKRRYKIPYVISEHWSVYLENKREYFSKTRAYFTKKVLRGASAITAVSKKLLTAIESLGVTNSYSVVPNVIDNSLFENRYYTSGPKKKFIHVSEFNNRDKNILGLLEVIHRISKERDDFEFHLVGYGAAEADVIDYITKHSLKDQTVHFHGKVVGAELAKLYGESDAFLLFSNTETFACVIIEALNSGTAVISTDVGVAKEVIDEKNGRVIDIGDQEAMYNILIDVLDGEIIFDRREVVNSIEQNYSPMEVSTMFDGIYNSVIN